MILAPVSDTHVNSTVGLWPPDFVDSNGTPRPQNRFQKWLWECWLEYCAWVDTFGKRIVVVNGDPIQGINKTKDVQLMVYTPYDQMRAAEIVLSPFLHSPLTVASYFIKGTEWHEGPSGQEIEELARVLGGRQNEQIGQYTFWLKRIRLDDKLFAFAHHSSMTTVYHHTPAQRAMREAKEAVIDDGLEMPDCIVRSHVHRFGVTPDQTGRRFYFTTPGWQLKNSHAFKYQPQTPPQIGGIVLWVDEGNEIRYRKQMYTIPEDPADEFKTETMASRESIPPETSPVASKVYRRDGD